MKVSFRRRGLRATLIRCALGPYYLLRAKQFRSEFDGRYSVSTDDVVFLEDLEIESANRAYGVPYQPTPAEVFHEALAVLQIDYQRFTFVDFGSGKGRVVLMASEYAFSRIIGIEFSPELHEIAAGNVRIYPTADQKCKDIVLTCADFSNLPLPLEPLVCYFFNPCSEHLMAETVRNIHDSFDRYPRNIFVIYFNPLHRKVFVDHGFDVLLSRGKLDIYEHPVFINQHDDDLQQTPLDQKKQPYLLARHKLRSESGCP